MIGACVQSTPHYNRSMTRSAFTVVLSAILFMLTAPWAAGQPVTSILTHGQSFNGEKGVWLESMANAIVARNGGVGAVYRYRQDTGAWQLVSGAPSDDEPAVLIFRWLEDFEKLGVADGFAEGAGDALHAALRDPIFVDQAGDPLSAFPLIGGDRLVHFIGHSRGPVVISECVQRLARDGVPVDHVTAIDPHPVNGTLDSPFNFDWGDPTPEKWNNTTFADNYWRADGGGFNSLDFDGIPLANHFNLELDEDALECCAYTYSHSDTHLWLHGTIDLSQNPCDGEECISNTMRNTWWTAQFPYQTSAYYWSQIGGGVADRPAEGLVPGLDPGEVPILYNGSWVDRSLAGWLYHGGSIGNHTASADGRTFLRLGSGFAALAQHNRFFLPHDAGHVELDLRVTTAAPGELLSVSLIDRDEVETVLSTFALDATTGWINDLVFEIDPPSLERDRVYRLALRMQSSGSRAAVVHLDNVEITRAHRAPLESFTMHVGSVLAGGLDDLRESDDEVLLTRSQFGFSVLEPNLVELRATATSPLASPQRVNFSVELALNNPGGIARLRLRDQTTIEWITVGSFTIGLQERVERLYNLDGQRFVRPADGGIEAAVRVIVMATFAATGFDAAFDQLAITVD